MSDDEFGAGGGDYEYGGSDGWHGPACPRTARASQGAYLPPESALQRFGPTRRGAIRLIIGLAGARLILSEV